MGLIKIKLLRRKYTFTELLALKKSIIRILLSPKKIINFLLVKISIILKLDRCLGLPFNIFVEPTGKCNYRCVKCEMFSKEYKDDSVVFKDKNMPFKYYRRIIDDIGDTLITLRLWHYGEPFLNPDIFHMIRYAKKKGIIVAISSNLSLLTKKKAKKLIYSGLDYLIVSFDGASEYTYNLYHGKDYFKKVVTNLRMLIELKKELKFSTPFIELQFIVMKENEREIEKIKYLAEKLGINKLTYQKLYGENINFDKFVGFDSLDDILPRNKNYCFGIKSRKWFNFCRLFWEETLVRYSGVVLPCVVDLGQKHQVGRLFNRNEYLGFKRIWNNDRYRKFRKNISKSIDSLDICRKCTKRNNSSEDQIYGSKI